MRFYRCFFTDLPDQFVEANAAALTAWVDGWADKNRYYLRARVIDLVPLAVEGDARKTTWPTLRATSASLMQIWMSKKGDRFDGRYWQTAAADHRGAADAARDPGGAGLADALAGTWRGPRNPAINLAPRARGGLTPQQLVDTASALLDTRQMAAFRFGAGLPLAAWRSLDLAQEPRPPLRRDGIVAGEIVGYRCWRVEQDWLRSVYQDDIWPPCEVLCGRELGDWDSRGIHAWKTATSHEFFDYLRGYLNRGNDSFFGPGIFNDYETRPAMVTGTVLLWGDVVEHERGWRAEFASVRSLDWLYPDAAMMGREQQTLARLRRRYGVDTGKTNPQPDPREDIAP